MLQKNLGQMFVVAALLACTVTAFHTPARGGPRDQPKLITISANDEDVRDVLRQLFNQAGASFAIAPGVTGTVTFSLNSVPMSSALQTLCHQSGLTYSVENGVYDVGSSSTAPRPLPAEAQQIERLAQLSHSGDVAAITTDASYVYVLRDSRVYKLNKDDLKMVDVSAPLGGTR